MYSMSEEETTVSKKDEELFGFKKADLGALLGAGALLGVAALAFHVLKPQLPGAQPQPQLQAPQPPQQTGYTPEQVQQIQAQQAQQQQQQQEQQAVQYGYATEQDPMSGKITKTRVREIESTDGTGSDRFNSISV